MVRLILYIPTAPSAPLNLTTVEINAFDMTLEWSVPENENGIIQHYVFLYYELSAPNTIINDTTTETTLTVENLRAFTEYVFRVYAVTVEEGPFIELNVTTVKSGMYNIQYYKSEILYCRM